MSGQSISENLFAEAKAAAGRVCFDISVDKPKCVQQARLLIAEIENMILALNKTCAKEAKE